MQLDEIAVGDEVIRTHLLAIEYLRAPYACELQAACNIFVYESRDVEHGAAAAHRKRFVGLGRFAGGLGIHAHDFEGAEKKRPQLIQAFSAFRRHRKRGKTYPQQFFEDRYLLGIGIEVALVRDQCGRQIEAKRIFIRSLLGR